MRQKIILPIKPNKSLGQNFLNSSLETKRIFESFNLPTKSKILEIGAGLGALTDFLITENNSVIAVEKDPNIYKFLLKKYQKKSNLKIFQEDILNFKIALNLSNNKYIVVGNLPFSHCVPILKWCLNNHQHFSDLYLSFPQSIAEKIINSKKNNTLQSLCNLYYETTFLINVKPIYFSPKPKILITFLHFKILKNKIKIEDKQEFESFLYDIFKYKRKKILNNSEFIKWISREDLIKFFKEINLNLQIRAENLPLETLVKLFKKINFFKNKQNK